MAFVLTTVRPAPPFTVRCSKVALSRDGTGATVELSNQTSRTFGVVPVRIEWRDEGIWKECQNGIASVSVTGDFGPHGNAKIFCPTKGLPRGKPLRLIMHSSTSVMALNSFALRARRWLSGDRRISLNPLDRKVVFYTDPVDLVTEEFAAP